ncbi:C1q-like domain-containing protein [Pseudomonas sp. H11T01]|uniref:C1q-like domain-containing protein n=1 Tax=Pseudomonas sp. H11T01 TaxID=3402749 RepID=UPI003AC251A8
MSYNTGNPIGSTNPRDLFDNAKCFDSFANGPAHTYKDRLGVNRKSIPGMIAEFDSDQSQRDSHFQSAQEARAEQFDRFMEESAYALIGDYGSGLVIERHSQYVMKDGQPYRLSSFVSVPYTTTGDWATESDAFVLLGDDVLRQELASSIDPSKGAAMVLYTLPVAGAVPSNLYEKAQVMASATLNFGADPTGATNSTSALHAFYTYCLGNGHSVEIPPGEYLVTPGQLDFSMPWSDRPFPHIITAGHGAVKFIAASDIDAPMLRINNGTANAALYKLWRGGSHGGITFVDPFSASTATRRHGLSIYGFCGTEFGYMKGQNLRGDLLHFERKLYAGNNPDPYNVSSCDFKGVESIGSLGYGINNDNSVGVTHCRFKFIRVIDGVAGGIRGLGVASEYMHISMGNQRGWAIDVPFDLLVGGRTTIRLLELDNCEKCYNIGSISGLDILESRIMHRYNTAPNTSLVYWPTVSYNVGATELLVTSLNIKGFHRTHSGGPLSAIGQFVNFNNNTDLRGCKIDLDISDNGFLGVLDTQLVTGLNRNSVDMVVTSRGKKVASTSSIIGCSVIGAVAQKIGTSGFASEAAKIIFPTELFDTGGNYDPATGYFKAPYAGIYRFRMQLTVAMPVGTRLRFGLSRTTNPIYLAGGAGVAKSIFAESYSIDKEVTLAAGDLVFVIAEQNSGASINLAGTIDATVENSWSIEAMH